MHLRAALDRTLLALEERKAGTPLPLRTGFPSLDRLRLGLLPGAVMAVECSDDEARLDFLLSIATSVVAADRAVLLVTRRPVEWLSQALLAAQSGVPRARFASGPLGKSDEEALTLAAARLWDRPLVMESANPGPYLGELVADAARQLSDKSCFDLVILDDASTRHDLVRDVALGHRVAVLTGSAKVVRLGASTLRLDVLRGRHSALHVAACREGVCLGEATLSWDPECARVIDDDAPGEELAPAGSARWWNEEADAPGESI